MARLLINPQASLLLRLARDQQHYNWPSTEYANLMRAEVDPSCVLLCAYYEVPAIFWPSALVTQRIGDLHEGCCSNYITLRQAIISSGACASTQILMPAAALMDIPSQNLPDVLDNLIAFANSPRQALRLTSCSQITDIIGNKIVQIVCIGLGVYTQLTVDNEPFTPHETWHNTTTAEYDRALKAFLRLQAQDSCTQVNQQLRTLRRSM